MIDAAANISRDDAAALAGALAAASRCAGADEKRQRWLSATRAAVLCGNPSALEGLLENGSRPGF